MHMGNWAKLMAGLWCALLLIFLAAACADTAGSGSTPTGTGTGTSTGTGTGASVDLSAAGVDTKTISHSDFTASATHSAKLCTECHAVTREKVCSQTGCHPFSKYAAVMTNWDHIGGKTGDQCDKCHYSAEKNVVSENPKVAGWRQSLRISHTLWHGPLKGICLDCHDIARIAAFPASHQSDPSRQTSCQTCHFYSINASGAAVWGQSGGAMPANHSEFTTGATHSAKACADCHTGVAAAKVCAQSACHPFSKYAAVTTHYDHTANNTGDRCSTCHKSIEVNKAGENPKVSGWRRNNRIGSTAWHTNVTGVCLDCHEISNIANFPSSHQSDPSRQTACEGCHFYKISNNTGVWGGAAHPSVTNGCANATCHTHKITTSETHYQGGTAPSGQHYNANTGGPYNCEWCHADAIASGYASWTVSFSKSGHQNWNGGSCKACHPNGGGHPSVATGCRAATCHTHLKPTSELNQASTNYTGQHYDSNPSGPYECEWCHTGVASGGYSNWSLPFSKHGHQNWNNSSCKACHLNQIPN